MKKNRFYLTDLLRWSLILILNFLYINTNAQVTNLSGYVFDENKEVLVGATVAFPHTESWVLTNQYGFFAIAVPAQKTTGCMVFSYAGSQSDTLCGPFGADTTIRVFLKNKTLQEVVISGDKQYQRVQMSVAKLPLNLAKKIPSLGGEVDIIKALAFTPGVTNGSEGSAGLFVRGGTPDQNLILLDNAVVYNPNHLFGFLSVFNADAIKNAELYKGGFPARYGGRISSVLDITMKEGSRKKTRGEGGIGLVASRALVEGPCFRGRGSYLVAGRSAYLSLVSLPQRIQYNSGNVDDFTNYGMVDLNAKVNYEISGTQKIFLSYYMGNDKLKVLSRVRPGESKNILQWGNICSTLRYIQTISSKVFWKNMLSFSNFN
jgi:TonB-dependent Receptor Plug Domain/CarboxypepD_reg-like domain